MQVSHVADHVTHAVIGGAQTIDFGISSSAEFFNILSSTLYSDQKLAVVREGLCNAWDAHIEAGCTHLPIVVTITEDKFIIKDVGKGIHRDDMGPIYGTYGNSTKKNDGKQTGGFGLGCKSPFAYTDHFEVISCHDGVKTIYNLSKSSAQMQGKPGIIPIASIPTTETGLQVSIGILNKQDRMAFRGLVERIARNGDMHVLLNGNLVEKLGFDTSKANYLVYHTHTLLPVPERICIRYGNVVYPVKITPDIAKGYTQVVRHLESLTSNTTYAIVFQAPPHSISVTPSRETLSMQEHTIKTLNRLFEGFLASVQKEFDPLCRQHIQASVDRAVQEKRSADLLRRDLCYPSKMVANCPYYISDLDTMAKLYVANHYAGDNISRKQDFTYRLQSMAAAGLLNRGLVQTYLRELETHHNAPRSNRSTWLQRQVVAPLLVKLHQAGLDPKRLYGYDGEDENAPNKVYRAKLQPLVFATRICPKNIFNAIQYLRNIVVVSHKQSDLHDRITRHPDFKGLGSAHGVLFYNTGLKQKEKTAALDFFKASGMTVIDMTQLQSWEVSRLPVRYEPKPKQAGLPSLASLHNPNTNQLDTKLILQDGLVRNLAPEFVLKVSNGKGESSWCLNDSWDTERSATILKYFGDKGGVTNNIGIYAKWLKQGVPCFEAWLEQKLLVLMASPQMQEYWAFRCKKAVQRLTFVAQQPVKNLAKVVYRVKELRDHFGLVNNLSAEEQAMIPLWNAICGDTPAMQQVQAVLNKIPMDPKNEAMLQALEANKLVEILDADKLGSLIQRKPDSPEAKNATAILLTLFQS